MSQQSPKIIACGHKHISVKTGNSFPAFLIQFPSLVKGVDQEIVDDGGSTQCCDLVERKVCWFWRTKRDFLLLNRALQKYDRSKSFPKKAFMKLCNGAIECGSWIRPDDDCCHYRTEINHILSDSADGKCLSIDSKFDPRLKKPLIVVDSFLCDMYNIYNLEVAACNGGSLGDENSSNASLRGIKDAWIKFCREEDTDGLIVLSFDNKQCYNPYKASDVMEVGRETNAARLGQYFASDENAKDVVETAFHLMNKLDPINKRFVFVEPSCGDGRIILELLNSRSHLLNDAIITGYDIDSSAIERSIENIDGFKMPSNLNIKPVFKCGNFLAVSRQDLALPTGKDYITVALGGPPYTPKDLPEKFILHSIQKLHASIVVFILPARCQKDASRIQRMLNSNPVSGIWWQFENRELTNINFDFEGSRVMQPSILQCWYRDPK